MSIKMNIKLKLIMEVITVIYILLCSILSKESLISSNITSFLTIIWFFMWGGILLYNKKLTGITDELVINILSKVNKICLYFLMFSVSIVSIFLISPYSENSIISNNTLGTGLMIILLVLTMMRVGLFIYYDKKGICE